ncbi:MAG: Asp-tRNA(Asn)/Glu-tRNA(Gln) amidotransferase subunit GatC [Pseudomonadota bacterium]|nr:Asp-tRNA(Asn)/Glu-tRNA(Gln) amidotransferase subunit GatC [Pseudomonadota bacterium]MED5274927.1 Asp-tRNA(Asn)/Glu-tRNA(Gln) amidotransferase subunit GatC [Pseudomonadota bacterium]|tara:strand:- start:4471 stop:4752 length:282 start_codon:yes stop_codon:yes gene_type:complete
MDKKTIIKIADLAKIDIDDSELDEITSSLSKILALVNEMDSVSTEGITPMAHPLNMTQRLRKDEVLEKNQRDELQKNNSYVDDGYYKVPKVIE